MLEEDPEYAVEIVLANAQQVKGLTGHKTDPQDARWLAHLLRHGMIARVSDHASYAAHGVSGR